MPKPPVASTDPNPRARRRQAAPAARTFEFVSSDPAGKPAPETRKFIRSYVMRGKNKKRHNIKSNNNPPAEIVFVDHDNSWEEQAAPLVDSRTDLIGICEANVPTKTLVLMAGYLPRPLRPPPDLTLFNFAAPVDDSSRSLIFRFFTTVKQTLYPAEWYFEFDYTGVCWFRWLLSDEAYLNSILFTVSAFQDLLERRTKGPMKGTTWSSSFSPQTQLYLRKTIALLQQKIENTAEQISDVTAAVVVSLAMMAGASGDDEACEAHVEGLKKMVKMRGGLDGFQSNRQMQMKLSRVDLGWSIKNGTKPDFFNGSISWDPLLHKFTPMYRLPEQIRLDPELEVFLRTWDYKLQNVFLDLRDFSNWVNSITLARKKLKPEWFQEIMLSIQYRLLHLEYSLNTHSLEEAVRLGLLAFETTVFLQIPGSKMISRVFAQQLRGAVQMVFATHPQLLDLKLWLLLIGSIMVFDTREPWLVEAVSELTQGQDWDTIRQRLMSIMWISNVHDAPGKLVLGILRQEQAKRIQMQKEKDQSSRTMESAHCVNVPLP